MTIERAKVLLWSLVDGMTDEEIQQLISDSKRFASIVVDFALEEGAK